ncbi:MAG TPA: c-type cytochrome [Pseudolabrys sp.]|nr:c-type cytochrome [Pseudolabrys sp.]
MVRVRCALQALPLAIALASPALASDELAAKLSYCQDCHGVSGQGYHGFYPIPRLAGQQPDYIKNQLQAFIERRRTNNIMFNVAHALQPSMIDGLVASFARLNPRPLSGGSKRLVDAGRTIFENGVPEANIAACAACHGPEAKGSGQIPRLAGQLPDYVASKLAHWSEERGQLRGKPDTSLIMEPVAHSLTKAQVEAVAAYVSYLR